MKKTLQRWSVSLTLAALLVGTVAPVAAFAQDDAPPAEKYTLISASCHDGACAVVLDQDGQALTVAPIPGYPLTWPLESPEASAASVELSDRLELNLPFGQFQILEGDFLLLLDENNQLERLHGTAQTVIPTFAMSDQVRIRGPFAASFGYDYGSALTEINAPLLPDAKYIFLSLGSGLDIDVGAEITATAESAAQNLTVSIPTGNSATIVIDPLEPLIFLDGEFVVRTGLPVDMVADMANVQLPDVPLLGGLTLPLRTPVGVSTLLSPRAEANFLELRGGLEVDGGIAQRVLKFDGKPLEVNGVARIDSEGIHFASGANSSLLASTPLSGGANVAVTAPNPMAEAPAWWDNSRAWLDEAGAGMAAAITEGWTATGAAATGVIGSAAGAVTGGAEAAAAGAGAAAAAVTGGAQAAAEGAGAAAAGVQNATAPLIQGATDAASAALENSAAAATRAAAAAQQAVCAWTPFCGDE